MSAIRVLTRTFDVPVALPEAWRVLADVEDWPRWAAHIRRVVVEPPGPVGPASKGTLHLRGGIRSTFAMREFVPGRNWMWAGPFLGLTVRYDHRFEAVAPERTRLAWSVDVDGPGAAVLGRLFGIVYARNVDRAIPALVAWIGLRHAGAGGASADAP